MKIASEISIIIPVYNRDWCVSRAVESAVNFIGEDGNSEIILVDDGSADSSMEIIKKSAAQYGRLPNISFKVCSHEKNLGVCAAKNTGARAANGQWLVFFDSDDELMPGGLSRLRLCLSQMSGEFVHFFTAISEQSNFNPDLPDIIEKRDFRSYLEKGIGGEALPVIKRDAFLLFPYDEDIRGYESLSYMRLAKHYGSVVVHSLGLRRYHTSNADRLSTKTNMRKRRFDLASGHMRALREHYRHAPVNWSIQQIMRTFYSFTR
jgi:glycosyltransferase involved in cell wall biosynthesis